MKKILCLLFLLPFILPVFCQQGESTGEAFYMLDANMKGTPQQKAVYFIHSVKIHDSCWQFDTYTINGPMISSEQYKNENGTEANGICMYFNKKGNVDSSGNFLNGLQNGSWYILNESGKYVVQKEYKDGLLISTKDLTKKALSDSANKTYKDEKESVFPGGVSAWTDYLASNMTYPQRAQNLAKQGTVVVQFIVDTQGHVMTAEICKSIEYSLDQEALRLIKQSPKWVPAFQNGKIVKSYKKQPISFVLQ